MSASSRSSPEMQRRHENASLPSTMGISAWSDCRENENKKIEAAVPTAPSASPSPSGTGCLGALAAVLLVQISSFSPESNLSGICRSTLSAIRALHYKVNIRLSFSGGHEGQVEGHMGVQESGKLATGRVVTRMTVMVGEQEVNATVNYDRN